MTTENRIYERVQLSIGSALPCEGIGFAFSGKVTVLGLGGVQVRSEKTFTLGTVLPLRIRSGADSLDIECIVRDFTPDGFGAEFVKLTPAQEKTLKEIIDRLQR
ncbi:MAG TPA: PilZ domain-containing protein [Candidatus Nitrosotenuis sp.]|nr:PilZ domain-containing protein [Candidatus Nitrosotenuis sp.]